MKIYHKRSFAGGILCLLLAVGCGALLAAEGFQTPGKPGVAAVFRGCGFGLGHVPGIPDAPGR